MANNDIIPRLLAATDGTPADIAALLKEAVEVIETLRILVGIRGEIELEDAKPAGHA